MDVCFFISHVLVALMQTLDSGNLIIIAASSSALLGLTWGGVQFSWTSVQVLVPLILGLCGMVLWVIYEIRVAAQPILSSRFFSNRTTVSG